VRLATSDQFEPALTVWLAANIAHELPPTAQRIDRIREKLSAADAVVLVAVASDGRDVVGMAQAEPWRGADGSVARDHAHISMVFVHPDRRRQGIGAALMTGLAEQAAARGWSRLSLWTRRTNEPARALYAGEGYALTGETGTLDDGDPIDCWARTVG